MKINITIRICPSSAQRVFLRNIIINDNNLTNSYWSIGSTMNVKEDRAQTREMGSMET